LHGQPEPNWRQVDPHQLRVGLERDPQSRPTCTTRDVDEAIATAEVQFGVYPPQLVRRGEVEVLEPLE
jgi:hypothetical protein